MHCNGVNDCGNQADEENCGEAPFQFQQITFHMHHPTGLQADVENCPSLSFKVLILLLIIINYQLMSDLTAKGNK